LEREANNKKLLENKFEIKDHFEDLPETKTNEALSDTLDIKKISMKLSNKKLPF
jgi:hypothetical protein